MAQHTLRKDKIPMGINQLSFMDLRRANLMRVPEFKDAQGRLCHPTVLGQSVGFDWALSKWSNAVFGEMGEAANIIKKIERGDFKPDEDQKVRVLLAKELADVAIYLDLLAHRAGVPLDDAIILKWNEVSERQGIDLRLGWGGVYRASLNS